MALSNKQLKALKDLPIVAGYNESTIGKMSKRFWVGLSGHQYHHTTVWSLVNRGLVEYVNNSDGQQLKSAAKEVAQ